MIPRERIAHAEQLWLSGRSSAWCQQQLRERWGVSTRSARRYLEYARKRLQPLLEAEQETARERAVRQLQAAFDAASAKGDAKGMVLAASRLAELSGVLGPQRVELSGPGGGPIATAVQVVELPQIADARALADNALEPESGAADALPGVSG